MQSEYQTALPTDSQGLTVWPLACVWFCRYGGGRAGLSDTLVGALWVLDSLCEFAVAGATGFHLHWGSGGWPDGTRGQPNTGIQTNFYWDYDGQKYEYKQLQAMRVSA